jgi:hypothetical protein
MSLEAIRLVVDVIGAIGIFVLNFCLLVRYVMRRDIEIRLMWKEYERKK